MPDTRRSISVRPAAPADAEIIARFNCELALETEGLRLDFATVSAGVAAALNDPRKARYFVACSGDAVVGQLMHTWEWSDWRNGHLWWLQSVYVDPEHRRRGVMRQLVEFVVRQAEADPEVVGVRLYVEEHNEAAQAVYHRLGLSSSGYRVMERLFPPAPHNPRAQ